MTSDQWLAIVMIALFGVTGIILFVRALKAAPLCVCGKEDCGGGCWSK